MSITQGLTKTILYVKDMDKQVHFYCNILDLTVKNPVGLHSYNDASWVEFATGECSLVLHVSRDKRLSEDRPKLAFSVKDIETAHKALTDRGAKLSDINSRVDGFKVADGFDPEGNPFCICCQEYNG